MPSVFEDKIHLRTPSRKWRLGLIGQRFALVAKTLGSSSGVGYRLRQAADLIQTDQVFARTLALTALMAMIEMGALGPLENYLFRWKKEAESS